MGLTRLNANRASAPLTLVKEADIALLGVRERAIVEIRSTDGHPPAVDHHDFVMQHRTVEFLNLDACCQESQGRYLCVLPATSLELIAATLSVWATSSNPWKVLPLPAMYSVQRMAVCRPQPFALLEFGGVLVGVTRGCRTRRFGQRVL